MDALKARQVQEMAQLLREVDVAANLNKKQCLYFYHFVQSCSHHQCFEHTPVV